MATNTEMVSILKTALESNAAVVSVSVDGTTVSYNRQQAIAELTFWEKRLAIEQGTRPRYASIKLTGF